MKQLSPYEVSIDDNGSSAPPHLTNISSSSSSSSSFGNCNGNSNGDRTRVTKPSIRTRRSIRTRNNSNSSNSSSVVSFGTVTVREYERKLLDTTDCEYSNVNGNVNLGLAIGWEYMELEPIDVHSIPTKIYFAEAELTTEVERAKILLATGAYTKQELRSALESKNRRRSGGKNNGNANNNNTDPLVDDNKKVATLKRVYKRPGRMIKRVSGKLSSLFISNDES
mmetsp:Transcript_13212/g.14156  ORF Transcript_13212/g.14156 Transcript_13212/m.14156 type:complete len:224 (+) Transcript_13212:41-712(+)